MYELKSILADNGTNKPVADRANILVSKETVELRWRGTGS